jgi:hypothetical protein
MRVTGNELNRNLNPITDNTKLTGLGTVVDFDRLLSSNLKEDTDSLWTNV